MDARVTAAVQQPDTPITQGARRKTLRLGLLAVGIVIAVGTLRTGGWARALSRAPTTPMSVPRSR